MAAGAVRGDTTQGPRQQTLPSCCSGTSPSAVSSALPGEQRNPGLSDPHPASAAAPRGFRRLAAPRERAQELNQEAEEESCHNFGGAELSCPSSLEPLQHSGQGINSQLSKSLGISGNSVPQRARAWPAVSVPVLSECMPMESVL